MKRAFALWLLLGLAATDASGQGFGLQTVLPSEPGKNRVRWWEFDWRWAELAPVPGGAPVRLYFYAEEEEVARLAASEISAAYEEYVRRFSYVPTERIPFHLYNSHFEFESTTAFFISEGVLGVTSTQDLTVALPYWGERRRFLHVMRHEMAHQFTIQKVVDAGEAAGCNPLAALPLWFVEGVAEFFALPGLTPEVRAVVADAFLDREGPRDDPDLPGFREGERSYERVYLMGHAQVRFLEERHGPGTIERILSRSKELCDPRRLRRAPARRDRREAPTPFAALVERVTGTDPEALDRAWRAWARAAVAPAFEARHALGELEIVGDLGPGEIDSFALSPDGRAMLYRMFDGGSGVSRLFLRDLESGATVLVAEDRRYGLASLHPRDRRVEALGEGLLAYVGRVGAADRVFVRPYRIRRGGGEARIELGRELEHEISRHHTLIEAGHPAFLPGDAALGFVGLSRAAGALDLYRLERPLDARSPVVRLTDDVYAEQGLAYAPDGSAVFATDATPDARFEIARRASPADVLTSFPGVGESVAPSPDPTGAVVFQSGASGFTQAYGVGGGEVTRRTDVPTSLEAPAVDAAGRLLGIARVDRERRLVAIPRDRWVEIPAEGAEDAPGEPWVPVLADLGEVREYEPFDLSSWRPTSVQAVASSGPFVLGSAAFADRFRARVLGLSLQILDDADLTSGQLVYLDRSGRLGVGGRLFVESALQVDRGDALILRRWGAQLHLEWPVNRFLRLVGAAGGVILQPLEFSDPTSAFAREHDRTYYGAEAGFGVALDTLRHSFAGAYAGVSAEAGLSGTLPFGGLDPVAQARISLQGYRPLVRGYERLFLHARIAGGTALGGILGEQFYLPPQYNLRSFSPGFPLVGRHYWIGQAELEFPLVPLFWGVAVQGSVGVDAGAVVFDADRAWEDRSAAAVVGGSVHLGGVALGLHFARPVDVGGLDLEQRWITHFTVTTPLFSF